MFMAEAPDPSKLKCKLIKVQDLKETTSRFKDNSFATETSITRKIMIETQLNKSASQTTSIQKAMDEDRDQRDQTVKNRRWEMI